jgi:hypothetical protein
MSVLHVYVHAACPCPCRMSICMSLHLRPLRLWPLLLQPLRLRASGLWPSCWLTSKMWLTQVRHDVENHVITTGSPSCLLLPASLLAGGQIIFRGGQGRVQNNGERGNHQNVYQSSGLTTPYGSEEGRFLEAHRPTSVASISLPSQTATRCQIFLTYCTDRLHGRTVFS